MVAEATMAALNIERLEVSPWALREGVVLQHIATLVDTDDILPLTPFALAQEPEPDPVITTLAGHR